MKPIRGRGAADNPANPYQTVRLEYERDEVTGERPPAERELLKDHTDGIISTNRSPDIPFNKSLNPYRGCEHGCAYCYARPTHEYLGFSAGLDFETKIVVKHRAPELLRQELARKSWKPETLARSGVTDPYQPVERELRLTRGCLEVLSEARHPLVSITKNHLVTRDIDLLTPLAEAGAVRVVVSVTTLDRELAGVMEPRTSRPARRIDAIRALSDADIPVSVNVAPIIPGLTDHECVGILEAAADAGASSAGYTLLRLPGSVRELFLEWLELHAPDRKRKVVNRLLDMRNGALYRSEFGVRFTGEGAFAEQIGGLFRQTVRRLGMESRGESLSARHFRRPASPGQMELL